MKITLSSFVPHPASLTHPREEYEAELNRNWKSQYYGWTRMMRNPRAYVRGRIWHPDHKTIVLDGWHRVVMNTEGSAPGARAVVFLD